MSRCEEYGIANYYPHIDPTVRYSNAWKNSAGDYFHVRTDSTCIQTNPLFVSGAYYLSQYAAGQQLQSRCVDTGDPNLVPRGTTRTDHVLDRKPLDMGYHYPLVIAFPNHN